MQHVIMFLLTYTDYQTISCTSACNATCNHVFTITYTDNQTILCTCACSAICNHVFTVTCTAISNTKRTNVATKTRTDVGE